MQRVNGADWVDIGGGKRGFRSQNAGLGIPGTEVTDVFLNDLQEALCRLVENSGGALAAGSFDLVTKAIRSQKLNWVGGFGGTANALTATLTPAPAANAELVGVPVRGLVTTDNTGPVTVAFNGLPTMNVRRPGGGALDRGDLVAGTVLDGIWDGTNFIITSSLISWIVANVIYTIGAGQNFADLNQAMTFLKKRLIAQGVTVTLSMIGGAHNYGADIVFDHIHNSRIQVIGAAMSGADPAIADFASTGTNDVDRATNVGLNNTMLQARYNTEIVFTGAFGMKILTAPLGFIDDVLLRGNGGAAAGISMTDAGATFGTVAVHGFGNNGFSLLQSRVIVNGHVTASGCGNIGWNIQNSSSIYGGGSIGGYNNGAAGGVAGDSSSILLSIGPSAARGNKEDGFKSREGSSLTVANSSQAKFNVLDGVTVINGSAFNGLQVDAGSNLGNGISCQGGSVNCSNGSANSNGVSGIANKGGTVIAGGFTANSNGSHGISNLGGFVDCQSIAASGNGGDNIRSQLGSINATSGAASSPGGGFFNFHAVQGGHIQAAGATGTGSSSPTVNVAGADNSMVAT